MGNMELNSRLAVLTQWREQHQVTQGALARQLGVSNITISRWETGVRKVDKDLIPNVSRITGISPADLRPDLAELLRPLDQVAS